MSDAKVYFGLFSNPEDIISNFKADEKALDNAEVLFAWYDGGGYDGNAFVIFRRDGRLYEVHGSHCSCYGLEEQWHPEETYAGVLELRYYYCLDGDAKTALKELLNELRASSS